MKAELIEGKQSYSIFENIRLKVYRGNKYYRGTDASIERMLLTKNSSFKNHSISKMFLIRDGNDLVARFALIHDFRLKDYVQVSFFEALPRLGDLFTIIKAEIKKHFPGIRRVVVGLNGHLNYGAGFLLNRFDEVPLFGLPYTHAYYSSYFNDLNERRMVSFRFPMSIYYSWANSYSPSKVLEGLTTRFMNKKFIRQESVIYTRLNNRAFVHHPYWADRDEAEDLELFYPFRYLLDNENLVIAEYFGEPVGFYLWYPDFNQLIHSQRDFNASDVLKYRFGKNIDTLRFTEIGIVPQFQGSPAAFALIQKTVPYLMEKGFEYCEGGFIFEENRASIAFVSRILQRCYGRKPEPYRKFAVYETIL
jgi:hypothetical protein